MTNEEIQKFMLNKNPKKGTVQISFKSRPSIKGLFIQTGDYDELRKKNLWRIVSESNITPFQSSGNENLARIFNGTDITRLELA